MCRLRAWISHHKYKVFSINCMQKNYFYHYSWLRWCKLFRNILFNYSLTSVSHASCTYVWAFYISVWTFFINAMKCLYLLVFSTDKIIRHINLSTYWSTIKILRIILYGYYQRNSFLISILTENLVRSFAKISSQKGKFVKKFFFNHSALPIKILTLSKFQQ